MIKSEETFKLRIYRDPTVSWMRFGEDGQDRVRLMNDALTSLDLSFDGRLIE